MAITTVEQYQVTAARIAARAAKDPAYKKAIVANPVGALKRMGIGVDATRELIREDAGLRSSAAGHLLQNDCTVTCICTSSCCVTCWLGTSSLTSRPVFGAGDAGISVSPEKQHLLARLVEKGHITAPR